MVETTTSILKRDGMVRKGGIQVKKNIIAISVSCLSLSHLSFLFAWLLSRGRQKSQVRAVFGFLHSKFFVRVGLQISRTQTKTLPNLRLLPTSASVVRGTFHV